MNRRRSIGYYLLRGALLFFGVVLLVFMVWRIQLARDVSREIAAIHAAGLPASGAELDKYYAAVPNDQNAAVKLAQAFLLLTNYSDPREVEVVNLCQGLVKKLSGTNQFSAGELELLAGYYAMNSNAVVIADDGVKLSADRYPIDLSWGVDTRLPHLDSLEQVAKLEGIRVLFDVKNGRAQDVPAVIVSTLGLAHTLDDEPLMMSKLVRKSVLNIAVASLQFGLNANEIAPDDLTNLYSAFVATEKTNQMMEALIGERALTIPYFRMSWADIQRYSQSDADISGPPIPGSEPLIFRVSGFFERDLRFYLQAMETNIALEALPPPKMLLVSSVNSNIETQGRKNFYIISSLLLPSYRNLYTAEATISAQIRAAQLALKVETFRSQNGRLPDKVDELVPGFIPAIPADPFDGQPMRYHTLTNGYVIYSVGSDLHDNGGRERPLNAKWSDQTEYDITFTVHR